MANQTAQITWRDQVPIATQFDDPYYSLGNGLEESRHVFLAGNDLPARFMDGFHIAELGFGTGLNFLATWALWLQSDRTDTMHFTSFEAYPMTRADMAQALDAYPELKPLADQLITKCASGEQTINFDTAHLQIIYGDARETLPNWQCAADAWFLDGFSPAKNPELWQPDLMTAVGAHTKPGGTFATYTSAGHVRRALEQGGFAVERTPGFGHKRHMSTGRKHG